MADERSLQQEIRAAREAAARLARDAQTVEAAGRKIERGLATGAAAPGDLNRAAAAESRHQSRAGGSGGGRAAPATAKNADAIYKQATSSARQLAGQEARLTQEFQRSSVALGLQSNAMRANGVLTTEFIAAAARGETTFRELGYQATGTIAKFGGWLGAGAAVFAAADAVRRLGTGAISTEQSVNQLSRVIPELNANAARTDFRRLAGQFNLPIQEVGDAAFQMGKIFHDQEDAMKATEASLLAVKVGELSVADSTRYLTAIQQGAKLSSEELTSVLDQANASQNKFGSNISNSLAGAAKAMGTFSAAGGDYATLLAIITTAQRATGQSGDVVGTAIQRAPNQIRQNVDELAAYGIEASAPIPEVFQQAFAAARRLSGEEIQKLAILLGGTQYGPRIFTPLLRQGELFAKVFRDTTGEASKGSALQELQKSLESPMEQLSQVGVSLERIGSNLSDLGFDKVFGTGLKTVNLTLTGVNELLEVLNKLPGPVTAFAAAWASVAVTLKGLRRFRFGDLLQDRGANQRTVDFFNQKPEQYQQRLARAGARGEAGQLSSEYASAISTERSARRELAFITTKERGVQEQIARDTKGQAITAKQREAYNTQMVGSQRKINTAQIAVKEAEQRTLFLQAQLAEVTERQALLANRRTRAAAAASSAEGIAIVEMERGQRTAAAKAQNRAYIPGTLDTPGGPNAPIIAPISSGRSFEQQLGEQRKAVQMATKEQGRVAKAFSKSRNSYRRLGVVGGLVAGSAGAAAAALKPAGGAIRNTGTKLSSAARGLFSMLGPIDLLLIGAFALYEAHKYIDGKIQEVEKQTRELAAAPTSSSDRDQIIKRLRSSIEGGTKQGDFFGSIEDIMGGTFSLDPSKNILGGFDPTGSRRRDDQQKTLERRLRQRTRSAEARRTGGVFSGGFRDEIENHIERSVKDLEKDVIDYDTFRERISNAIESISKSRLKPKRRREAVAKAQSTLIEQDPSNQSIFTRLFDLAPKQLNTQIESLNALVESGAASEDDLERLSAGTAARVSQLRGRKGYAARARIAELNKIRVEAIKRQGQEQLDEDLALARGQGDRNRAYEKFFNQTRSRIDTGNSKVTAGINKQIREDRTQIDRLIRERATEKSASRGESLFNQAIAGKAQGMQIRELRKRVRENKKQLREVARQQGRDAREIKLLMQEMREQRYEENAAIRSARSELRVGGLQEGMPRIRAQIQQVGGEIQRAIKIYGRNSIEVLGLMKEQQSLADQAIQEQLSNMQADAAFSEAGLEGKKLITTQVSNLSAQRNFLAANKGSYAEIRQLDAQIQQLYADQAKEEKEAAKRRAERQRERIRSNIESLYELRASRTEDPVALARLEAQEAKLLRRRLGGRVGRNERRGLQAEQNNALRNKRNQEVDARLEDIRHRSAVGKLSNEQEVRQLQQLLKTHKMGRDARRRIEEQIYQLKNETDESQFDLQVGNIRLPTIYEIRRAVQTTQGGQGVAVNNSNNVNVTISDPSAVPAFAAEMERITGSPSSAYSAAAGMR